MDWTQHPPPPPYFLPLTLELQTWVFCATHRLMMVNISAKLYQNPSRNGKVMDQTRKKDPIFSL